MTRWLLERVAIDVHPPAFVADEPAALPQLTLSGITYEAGHEGNRAFLVEDLTGLGVEDGQPLPTDLGIEGNPGRHRRRIP